MTFPHNAMYFSDDEHGGASLLEITGDRLDFKWICADGVIRDRFTILHRTTDHAVLRPTTGHAGL